MISLILFILLLTVSTSVNRSLPRCISECYYILGHWFTLLVVLMAFSMLPVMIDANEDYQALAFLTCTGIIFVGVAAEYSDKFTLTVHKYSALISAICGTTWCILVDPGSLICLSIAALAAVDRTRWLFWIETACFLTVYKTVI